MKAKKIFTSLFCTLFLFSALLTACGTGSRTGSTIGADPSFTQNTSDNSTQIPNPWEDCSSLEEAQQLAGFSIQVPDSIDGYPARSIQVMDTSMIQVLYENDQDQQILIRKGTGSDDISGDYNSYNETTQTTLNDFSVTFKGNDGKIMVAIWSDGSYSYAIDASGLTSEEMTALIEQVL